MDKRDQFLSAVCAKLGHRFGLEEMEVIRNTIALELEKFELADRSTELAIVETESEQLLKLWLGSILSEGCSVKTAEQYWRILIRFRNDAGVPLKEASAFHLRLWIAQLNKEGTSMRTCENYRAYVNSFYSWLAKEDMIPKNPMQKVKPIKYNSQTEKAFSAIELDKIRNASGSIRNRAIIEVLLATGVRVEELCNLKVADIDHRTMEVHVRAGKGNKERVTYINEMALEYLGEYLEKREEESEYLFTSRKKTRIQMTTVRNFLKEIEKRTGVQGIHPHRFRKTFATKLNARGVNVRTIQLLMGHSDINTTMGYISQNKEKAAMEYKLAS